MVDSVSFICTRTDDMNVSETMNNLDIKDEENGGTFDDLQREQWTKEEERGKMSKRLDDLILKANKLNTTLEDHTTGSSGDYPSLRRKHDGDHPVRSKQSAEDNGVDKDYFETGSTLGPGDHTAADAHEAAQFVIIQNEKKQLIDDLEACRSELSELVQTIADKKRDIEQTCILARNDNVKSRIAAQFAKDRREAAREAAEERDPENYDLDDDSAENETLADVLPVFCVSAIFRYERFKQFCQSSIHI